MFESISVTPSAHRKQRICLPLGTDLSRKKAKCTTTQLSERIEVNKHFSQQIPNKKGLRASHLPSFFENSPQSSRIVDSRAIKLAQSELQQKYKCDLSGYLRKKFKKYIGKRHELQHRDQQHLAATLSRSSSQERMVTMRQLLTLDKYDISKYHKSTLINEAYLLNAKQKIDRMVELKRQREDYYSDIRTLLKKKLMDKAKLRQKTEWKSERKKEEWEKEWISDYIKQKDRYRKRLLNKSINKRYQLSPP